jgi:hypothetical protein
MNGKNYPVPPSFCFSDGEITDGHLLDHGVDLAPPEIKEPMHPRISRYDIQGLPQKFIHKMLLVGHVVENVYRDQLKVVSYDVFKILTVFHRKILKRVKYLVSTTVMRSV